MKNSIQVINTCLPVIIMLLVGMLCRAKNAMSREGIDTLKKLVINITLPAVIINAFATLEFTFKNVIITVIIYISCLVTVLLGRLLAPVLREKSGFLPFLTTGFEAGMIGYALYILLYGSDTVGSFASVDLGQSLFVFTLYKVLIGLSDSDKKMTGKQIISDMAHSAPMIAVVIGVLIGATGLYQALIPSGIASILDACTDFISAPTGAVILLTIGYDLVLKDVPWGSVIKQLVSRVIIMLVLRIALGFMMRVIGMGDTLDHALNILVILPPPFVLPIFANDEDQRTYLSSSLSVDTLFTVVAFIVLAAVGV